jgi:hypothetical protein
MFPQQIAEGLAPWKTRLELRLARDKSADTVEIPVNSVSPLWGKSYVEIGMEGHAQHRSQGTPAFFGNAFFRRPIYLVRENSKGELGKFDAKLLAQPLSTWGEQFGGLQAEMARPCSRLISISPPQLRRRSNRIALRRRARWRRPGRAFVACVSKLGRSREMMRERPLGSSLGSAIESITQWCMTSRSPSRRRLTATSSSPARILRFR